MLTKALYILVFMLTGLVIKIPYTTEFFITSGILFAAYTAIRFVAVGVSVQKYTIAEKIYMALNAPKGVATAAVVFILAVYNIEGIKTVVDMTFAFILYSILLSSLVMWIGSFKHEDSTHRH